MEKIKTAARRLFASTPAMALAVVAIGAGIAYGATNGDGDKVKRAQAPVAGPGGEDLSDSERQALETFHECMRNELGEPGEGGPPDPDKADAAFEKCAADLPDGLREDAEERHQQIQAFQQCMEEQGVEPPSGDRGDRPSEEQMDKVRKAHEACADKLPEGAALCGPGGPGGPGGPHGPGGPGGPPPPDGASAPGPPPGGPGGGQGDTGRSD